MKQAPFVHIHTATSKILQVSIRGRIFGDEHSNTIEPYGSHKYLFVQLYIRDSHRLHIFLIFINLLSNRK